MKVSKNNRISSRQDKIVDYTSTIIALILCFITLYPFYQCVVYSFNDGMDAMKRNLYFWPRVFTLNNYKIAFQDNDLVQSFIMSVLRTGVGTVTSLFFTGMVAYGLSKEHLVFRKFYSILFIITMYFSGGLIPSYLLLRSLRLLNTFAVYIIPGLFAYFNALLFMAFFREMPSALEESAKIDGANDFRVFCQIIIPLAKPVFATVALFIAVGHWNDWFTSAYYITDMKLWTMPTILMRVLNSSAGANKVQEMGNMNPQMMGGGMGITLESVRNATMVITVLPIALVYPFLQKYFIKGMMVGSIKA